MKRFGYLTRLLDNTPAKKMMEKKSKQLKFELGLNNRKVQGREHWKNRFKKMSFIRTILPDTV